jgi:hypothetical protein
VLWCISPLVSFYVGSVLHFVLSQLLSNFSTGQYLVSGSIISLYNTQLVGNVNLQDSFLLSPIANILRLTTLLPSSHHPVSSVLASSLLMYMFLMGELDLMD